MMFQALKSIGSLKKGNIYYGGFVSQAPGDYTIGGLRVVVFTGENWESFDPDLFKPVECLP